MNIIKSFIQWRSRKKELRLRQNYLKAFATFEQAERSRLLFIDEQNRRVLLSDMLTAPFVENDEKWKRFFNNLAIWFRYRILQNYWEHKAIEAETAAVREARHEYKHLSSDEQKLVRLRARGEIEYEQPEDMEELLSYDFCICEGLLRSNTQAEAVGRWENGHINLLMTNL